MSENKNELFSIVRYKVRDFLELSNNEYVLLDVIYQLSNNPNNKISGFCYATQTYLATMVGITRSNLNKMIKRLEDRGLLERKKATNAHKKVITIYRTSLKWYNSNVLGHCTETAQQPVPKQHNNLYRNSTTTCTETAHKNTYNDKDINKDIDSEVSPVGITSEDLFFKNQKDTQQRKKVAPKKESDPTQQPTNLLHQNQLKAMEVINGLIMDKGWIDMVKINCGGWDEEKDGSITEELVDFHAHFCSDGNYLTKTQNFINKKFAGWLRRSKRQFKKPTKSTHTKTNQPQNHYQVKQLAKKSIEGGYGGEGAW